MRAIYLTDVQWHYVVAALQVGRKAIPDEWLNMTIQAEISIREQLSRNTGVAALSSERPGPRHDPGPTRERAPEGLER